MRTPPALAALALAAGVASAQPTATVTITANGQSAVTVDPGQPVTIALTVVYQGAVQLGAMAGDIRVAQDAGTGSNFVFNLGAGPLINTGSFVGGSRVGMDVASGPPGLFPISPLWSNIPINMLHYTLIFAPTDAGTHAVNWQASPVFPNVRLYPSATSAALVEAQSTYIPATITVTPAPASIALLALAAIAPRRRR